MSGIADILLSMGYNVSGSDRVSTPVTDRLMKQGIKIIIGHFPENVHGADIVVYTAAIKDDNPEMIEAKNLNIQLIERSEFLGKITQAFNNTIAISGTHGKTTTTSIMSSIFLKAGKDPTVQVGADLDILNNMNYRVGNSDIFIVEACEYVRSFLKFYPKVAILLNIEADHLDYYKDISDIKSAFYDFASIPGEDGFIIANADDANVLEVSKNHNAKLITFAINNLKADYIAKNIKINNNGGYSFDAICTKTSEILHITLNIPGIHHVYNALAAITTSKLYEIANDDIVSAINEFHGAKRRFEYVGEYNGASIYDDYAHHPTEIKATIAAAKNILHSRKENSNKLLVVFQPHTYSRTYALFDDFSTSFENADVALITDIYAAREKDTGLINSKKLVDKINEMNSNSNCHCIYSSTLEDAKQYLISNANPGDIILTIGAGTITNLGRTINE